MLAASAAVLGHLRWLWIPAVIVLEAASMAALAGMQRRLLATGGARVRVRPMLATALAANALSVSVPVAGPELGTAFAFRRFTGQGADATLAVWSLVVGGVVSTAAGALLVVGGGLSSGNFPVTVAAVATGLLAAAAIAAAVAATRRPRVRGALEKSAAWMLRHGTRLSGWPAEQPGQVIRSWASRLGSLRLPRSGWITVTALALANWLADAAVFAVSIQAVGAPIPWHVLLLAYGSGVGAQILTITPGGFGVTEGALGLALVAGGLRASQALAAVLLYRLVSFWLIASAGWLILFWLRRHRRPAATPGRRRRHPAGPAATASARPEQQAAAAGSPGAMRRHDLVLLHGQPGTGADWQQVFTELPVQLRVVAPDRPGYGSSPQPPAGFAAGARTVVDQLDSLGIRRAVLVGHSYGGGVALSAAALAPHRIEAVVLLASVGPGCMSGWDKLLAAPAAGPLCALLAWRLTPWIARARLAWITRLRGRPLTPGEHANWQVWAAAGREQGRIWRTFLVEQRALVRELDELVALIPTVQAPALLLADPKDNVVPVRTARRLARGLPDARLQLIEGAGHHLPRRAPSAVAGAITAFLAAIDSTGSTERDR